MCNDCSWKRWIERIDEALAEDEDSDSDLLVAIKEWIEDHHHITAFQQDAIRLTLLTLETRRNPYKGGKQTCSNDTQAKDPNSTPSNPRERRRSDERHVRGGSAAPRL